MRKSIPMRSLHIYRLIALLVATLALACPVHATQTARWLALSAQVLPALDGTTDGSGSCGHVSTESGTPPRSESIFRADIVQIDGNAVRMSRLNYALGTGKHILVVGEKINPTRFNTSQLKEIARMQHLNNAGFLKPLILDVQPGITYRIGARLLRDKMDTQGIRDNAYWEPVVWQEASEPCP